MKKSIFMGLVAILGLIGCTRNQEIDIQENGLTLLARTESPADTKTVVEEGVHVYWEPGDEIAVFMGEKMAKFSTDITAASGTATFKGTFGDESWPEELDLWAVYPYSEEAVFDGETITTTISSVQIAREESFAQGANVSIAHSTSSNLQFYNVCGGVRFTVEEEGISSVRFVSSNHEPIAGKVKVSFKNDLPYIDSVIKGEDSIVLYAPEGTAFVPGKFYYFTALPVSLSAGYTLSLFRDNQSASKEYQDMITIKRSLFGTLQNVDRGIEYHDIVTQEVITPITSIVEECILAGGNDVNALFTQRIDEIRNNPAVDEAFSNENGALVFLKNGAVIEYPFHSESAFDKNDDSSTPTNNVKKYEDLSTRATNSSTSLEDATIVVFNLFSNAPGRKVQNQLIESTVDTFMNYYGEDKVYYGQYEDFTADHLSEAIKSENCKALFVYSLGSGSGSMGELGDRLKEKLGFVDEGSIYYGQRLAIGEGGSIAIEKVGYTIYSDGTYYSTIKLDSFFASSDDYPTSNKIIYFGSCYTLGLSLFDKDEWKKNTCVIGWTGMNCLGEAYGLVMAEYLTKYNKSFNAFWDDFGNSDGEIIDPLRDGLTSITNTCKSELVRKGAQFLGIDSWPRDEGFETHPNSLYISRPQTGTCFRNIWYDATDKDYSIDVKVKYQTIANPNFDGSQASVNATAYGFLFKHNAPFGGEIVESPNSSQEVVFSIGTKTKKNTFSGIKSGVVKFEVVTPGQYYPLDVVYTFITKYFGYNDAQFDDPDEDKPTPEAVDLGLPSGIKWASFNLGASKPEEYGDYYAWGETEPNKDEYSWGTYSWCNGNENSLTKYFSGDGKTALDQADDAAYNLLGGEWRIPNQSDWQELINYCSWTTTSSNGINGVLATSKMNGASIFFPFSGQIDGSEVLNMESSGYYWTSTLNPFVSLANIGTTIPDIGYLDRYIGLPIRPVYGEAKTTTEYAVPEAIDLGLSVKWASFNLGATKPEEYGDYFAWGETEPYYESGYAFSDEPLWKSGKESGYDWPSYKWSKGSETTLTKYCIDSNYGYNGAQDGFLTLDSEDDAACVNLGDKWRMPTEAEQEELMTKCTWVWTTVNDRDGYRVTGPNGNSIFLPAAGFRRDTYLYDYSHGDYWSSSLYTGRPDTACAIEFYSNSISWVGKWRTWGLLIRPVYDDSEQKPEVITPEPIDLGLPSGLKWASFNLGASKPEEYGDYYAWGETEPYYSSLDPLTWKDGKKSGYTLSSYKWCMGGDNSLTKYCWDSSYGYNGYVDEKTVLDPEDDAAHVNLGGKWRMPTYAEWEELRYNCTWIWTERNGVSGLLLTSNVAGFTDQHVFFPSAGFWSYTSLHAIGSQAEYWSSSLYSNGPFSIDDSDHAWAVTLYSSGISPGCSPRYYGKSIRPVYDD